MGQRMRDLDWTSAGLGPAASWPQALKTAVRMMLTTRHPIFIFWGPHAICFYNDAYSASLGPEKHPALLGMPGQEGWPEIWAIIGPQITQVMRGGGATWHEDHLVPILRHGRIDEVYWTYSYGPIDDETAPGGIGGVLVICRETTPEVLAGRTLSRKTATLRRLFDQAPGFLAVLSGPDHVFELANAAYRKLVGERSLDGRTVRDAFPELAGTRYCDLLDQVYRSGEPYIGLSNPVPLSRTPGAPPELHHIDFIYQPAREADGRVSGIIVQGSDVSENVRAQAALRESEARYRGLFNSIETGFCILEVRFEDDRPVDYLIVEANPAFTHHTGHEGLEGRWIRDAVPGIEEHWIETYGRVARTGEPVRFENHAEALGGRWFDVYAFRIGDPAQHRVAVLFSDITDRRQAEEALRASEERWRSIFQNMHEGFVVLEIVEDAEGRAVDFRIVEQNVAVERLTGLPREAMVGRLASEAIPGIEPHWLDTYARVARTGEPTHMEMPVAPLGRWFEVFAYPAGGGQVAALFLNVTERRAAQARQALLAGEVDHRAKNMLAIVLAMLRHTRAQDIEDYIEAVSGRVSALSRAHAALARDQWSGADFRTLLREELVPFMDGQDDPGGRVVMDGPPVLLRADMAQPLAMAVHELATNAAKHGALSGDAGALAITWHVAGGGVTPRVLHLAWIERGGPCIVERPARAGFGSQLLAGTVEGQMGGLLALTWDPGGLTCRMELPLDERPG